MHSAHGPRLGGWRRIQNAELADMLAAVASKGCESVCLAAFWWPPYHVSIYCCLDMKYMPFCSDPHVCREAGGVLNLVGVLQQGPSDLGPAVARAVVQALLALAVDDASQDSVSTAGGLPSIVKLIGGNDDVRAQHACMLSQQWRFCCAKRCARLAAYGQPEARQSLHHTHDQM